MRKKRKKEPVLKGYCKYTKETLEIPLKDFQYILKNIGSEREEKDVILQSEKRV